MESGPDPGLAFSHCACRLGRVEARALWRLLHATWPETSRRRQSQAQSGPVPVGAYRAPRGILLFSLWTTGQPRTLHPRGTPPSPEVTQSLLPYPCRGPTKRRQSCLPSPPKPLPGGVPVPTGERPPELSRASYQESLSPPRMPHRAQAAVTHRGAARAKDTDLGETGPWEQHWTETAGEARPQPEACPDQGGRERDWAPGGRTGRWHQDTRKRRTGTPSCWGQRAWDPAALSKSPEVTWSARRRQGGARPRPGPPRRGSHTRC